jgi:hypothetical protein
MPIYIRNRKLVPADAIDDLISMSTFVINKFIMKPRRSKIEVTIVLRDDLYEKEKQYGNCIWEDTHYRPNEFTIQLDTTQNRGLLLNSLAHELVHVKQWAKGEMFEMQRQRKLFKYNGRLYNQDKINYWDQPWEIEAHGRAIGLVVQWVNANRLDPTKYIPEGT